MASLSAAVLRVRANGKWRRAGRASGPRGVLRIVREISSLTALATLDRSNGPFPAPVAAAARAAARPRALRPRPAAARADWHPAVRRPALPRAARAAQVGQGAAAAPAEGEAADDLGVDARVGRRLRADLGLDVRGRVRRAALHPRDGALHPAP